MKRVKADALQVTYLGWQGWLIQSDRVRLLVDPLLGDDVGRGPRDIRESCLLWPPRRFDWREFPAVDALFLSHEHEDHFNIPSLARIHRSIPVYLSGRASWAAQRILADMGFPVRRLMGGSETRFGDLTLSVFAPDHLAFRQGDEWETLAFLVSHRGGAGAFFTNVDCDVTGSMLRAVGAATGPEGRTECLTFVGMRLNLFGRQVQLPTRPEEMHRRPRNTDFLPAAEALACIRSGTGLALLPGQTAILSDGRLVAIRDRCSFLATPPATEWPPRPTGFHAGVNPLQTRGRVGGDFDRTLLSELEDGLSRFAEHLYGRSIFKVLYSLSTEQLEGRKPTFAWLLRVSDQEAFVYEYQPESCDFARLDGGESAPGDTHAGMAACWAADLLGLFRGEFEPRQVPFFEHWHPAARTGHRLRTEVWEFFHPLRHPQRCLDQYRRALAAEVGASVLVVPGHPAARRRPGTKRLLDVVEAP